MSQSAKAQEPSMEEILASIRRIIADDDATKTAEAAPTVPASAKPSEPRHPVIPPRPSTPPAPRGPSETTRDELDALLAEIDRNNQRMLPGAARSTPDAPDLAVSRFEPLPPTRSPANEAGTASARPAVPDAKPQVRPTPSQPVSAAPVASGGTVQAERSPAQMRQSGPATSSGGPSPVQGTNPTAAARVTPPLSSNAAGKPGSGALADKPRPGGERAATGSETRVAELPSPPAGEALLSPTTTAAIDQAFGALAQAVLGHDARQLEEIVREMLRPLLKTWLDDNLPGLVERLVRAEIERVSRGRP